MEKLNRWMAMHPVLCRILSMILWVAVGVWWIELGVPKWLTLLFIAVAVYVFSVYITTADQRLLKKPLEILNNQCDPIPLLEESSVQRAYPGNGPQKQIRDINYAMALRNAGDYDAAYMILTVLNIDKYAGTLPLAKVIYYNNLMDLCGLMGKHQEAIIWYEKLRTMYHDMKPGKQKERLRHTVQANLGEYYFCKGEYDRVLHALCETAPRNLSEQVENAMMYARTYLAMGEREKAKKPLQFVAENGNKLYFAKEAKMLLEKITMEEHVQ